MGCSNAGQQKYANFWLQTAWPNTWESHTTLLDQMLWWRRAYFGGDGTTTNDQSCATCDADGDGQDNLAEVIAETLPNDATSVFRILSILPVSGGFEIKWSSVSGRTYQVRFATNLLTGFTAISNAVVTATGSTSAYTNTPVATPARFYDVQVLP